MKNNLLTSKDQNNSGHKNKKAHVNFPPTSSEVLILP